MFCSSCGNQVSLSDKFCRTCGALIAAQENISADTEAQPPPSLKRTEVAGSQQPSRPVAGIVVSMIMGGIITLLNLVLLIQYVSTGLQQDEQVMFLFMAGAEMLVGASLATGGVLAHLGHRNGVHVMRITCWAGTALLFVSGILVYKPDALHPGAAIVGAVIGAVVGAFIRYGIVLILIRNHR
jgi:hypothetical protein